MKDKLEGKNPSYILRDELKESRHAKRDYAKSLLSVIQGVEKNERYKLLKERKCYLSVEE